MRIEFNDEEFASFLTGLGAMNEAVEEGLLVAFESIARDVAGRAAKGAPYKRGHLRSSILWDTFQQGNGIVEATGGSNLVYARIQELGGYTGRGYHSFIRPKLYLTSAVQEVEPTIPDKIDRWIKLKIAEKGL